MIDVWPFVSIYHSLGLNIAIVSYNGSVFFGLLADRDLVPDLEDFAHHLKKSVEDYREAALTPSARKAGRKPRRSRRAARPRQQAAQDAVDLGVDDQPVVAAPNGDRGNIRPKAAAKVHDVV